MTTTHRFPEGTTARYRYTILDQDRHPISLVGAQLDYGMYLPNQPRTGSVAPIISKTIGSGIVIVDAPNGVMQIEYYPHETVDMAGIYDWELELRESNGDTWLAGSGKVVILPGRRLDT
jgi:hypothetical protein